MNIPENLQAKYKENMKQVVIFIDEAGTLPDPQDRVVIVAAVGSKLPQKLVAITKSVRKFLKNKALSEIKFYRAGERIKKKFLEKLTKEDLEIFVLTIEKHGQKITDTPENFALLCWLLLEDCLAFYQSQVVQVIFDRHFHRIRDQERFNRSLIQLLKRKLDISHVDSQKDPRVNVADMVAGSLLWQKTGKDDQFYRLIKEKIVAEKVIDWKKLRGRFFQQKISSNRRKRPSERE